MAATKVHKRVSGLTPARRRMLRKRMASVPFPNLLGMKLLKLEAGEAQISMTGHTDLHQYQGRVHGGAIASLADTAATFAALASVPDGVDVVTIEFKLNFLAAFKTGRAIAIGRLVHLGRRTCVADVSVIDSRTKDVIAVGLFSMLCIQSFPLPASLHGSKRKARRRSERST